MDKPKISIITVSYNAVKTIEQTIQSVVNQAYDNIEYIIIDGGSTDGTVDVIKKYEDKIAHWVSEPDTGIYNAMNKGISRSVGEYIYFLGADDRLISNNSIKDIIEIIIKQKDIDVFSAKVWHVDYKLNIKHEGSNIFNINDIYMGYTVPHQGLFVKNSIMKKNKFLETFSIVADYELFLRLYFSSKIKFQYVNRYVAYVSLAGISSTNEKKRIEEHVEVMRLRTEIPDQMVQKYRIQKLSKKIKIKKFIKMFLAKIGLLKPILLQKGWKEYIEKE